MSRYDARLTALEEVIAPRRDRLHCVVSGDEDADAAIARFRAARNWPDDGAHPVDVLRIERVIVDPAAD